MRHAQKDSLSNLSIIESEEEVAIPAPKPSERPFSFSNTYPFTTSANGYGSQNTTRTLNHKPSSRFSEDEKRENVKSVGSANELQSSTWNLFGRSATASPMWGNNEKLVTHGVASSQQKADMARRKKRRIIIIVACVLIALLIAGAGTAIGIWQGHKANDRSAKAAPAAGANDADGTTNPSSTSNDAGISNGKTADVQMPARDANASPGSGGPGGYNQIVAFGGSYGGKLLCHALTQPG